MEQKLFEAIDQYIHSVGFVSHEPYAVVSHHEPRIFKVNANSFYLSAI